MYIARMHAHAHIYTHTHIVIIQVKKLIFCEYIPIIMQKISENHSTGINCLIAEIQFVIAIQPTYPRNVRPCRLFKSGNSKYTRYVAIKNGTEINSA